MVLKNTSKNALSERDVDRHITRRVEALGGWSLKLGTDFISGLPDRLILLPKGRLFFCEVKRPNKKPRPLQKVIGAKLIALGFIWIYTDSPLDFDIKLNDILKDYAKL